MIVIKFIYCIINLHKNILVMKTLWKIFILIPLFSVSQEITYTKQHFLTLDSINNQIIFQIKDSLHFIDIESLNIITTKKVNTSNLLDYSIVKKDSSLLFLEKQGGSILKLDSNDSLKKIDNSNINKFFIDNFNFVRKDTLFKHGGYGYWLQSNFLTYYDESTKQWEIYPIAQNSKVPRSVDSHIGITWNNSYSFFGGASLNENGYRIRNKKNKEVWSFNFISKKWSLMGKFKAQNLYPAYAVFSNKSDLYLMDQTNQLHKIDFLNNTLTKYRRKPILYDFYETNPFYYNDFIYYINNKGKVSKVSLEEITNDIEHISEFYFNTNRILTSIIILIIISLSLYFGVLIYRKNNKLQKLQFLPNGITYKKKFIELDSLAISILKNVIKKEMEFSMVYELVSKEHLSKIQNDRNRNEIIAHINFKLKELTNTKSDFLIVSKSKFDKRYKTLSVNKSDYSKFI
jgi:hypothetical protein